MDTAKIAGREYKMTIPHKPIKKEKLETRKKVAWVIKFIISGVLIYLVLTDGGKSTISETFKVGNSSGGKVENILVIALLVAFVIMLFKEAYERFSDKPKFNSNYVEKTGKPDPKNKMKR